MWLGVNGCSSLRLCCHPCQMATHTCCGVRRFAASVVRFVKAKHIGRADAAGQVAMSLVLHSDKQRRLCRTKLMLWSICERMNGCPINPASTVKKSPLGNSVPRGGAPAHVWKYLYQERDSKDPSAVIGMISRSISPSSSQMPGLEVDLGGRDCKSTSGVT